MGSSGEARMLIDGKLVDAEGGRTFANVNPATELEIGQVADAGARDAQLAIQAARRAFDETNWSTDHAFRAKCLTQLHDALEREKESLRPLVVAEVGCPIMLTFAVQLDIPIDDMQWPIGLIGRYEWEQELGEHEFFGMNSRRILRKEPVGVVAAITPWNYPIQVNLAKCIPALAAGNTVILKPAPDTPWSATVIGRLVAEQTDIPPGVFNVVTALDPAEVGEVLTSDPRVDCVSFTGSTAVGRRIMANAAPTVKKVFLELGGKSAAIFLDDADFSGIGAAGAMTAMHGGQGCAMLTRYLIPASAYDESVEQLTAAFEAVPYGDPNDMANVMGPLVNARQRDRVLAHIETGKREGARLMAGGGRPAHLDKGYFVEPTLFVDVDPDSTIAQEEIFGPVLAVIRYEGDDQAVSIANNSVYGLSGGVQSASLERAMGIARKIRTGTLSVNGGMYFGPDAPFGGYKQSGVGREMGVLGFEEFLETKTIGLPASAGA
jgi:aldehyde dehydrogenase (NAD+)